MPAIFRISHVSALLLHPALVLTGSVVGGQVVPGMKILVSVNPRKLLTITHVGGDGVGGVCLYTPFANESEKAALKALNLTGRKFAILDAPVDAEFEELIRERFDLKPGALKSSQLLIDYLRNGQLGPLRPQDNKETVIAKLGTPSNWHGREKCFTWHDPIIEDFRHSLSWNYESLWIRFTLSGSLLGCALDFHDPIKFSPPFTELPTVVFSLRDLRALLDREQIPYDHDGTSSIAPLLTRGGIAALTGSTMGNPMDAPVTMLCFREILAGRQSDEGGAAKV